MQPVRIYGPTMLVITYEVGRYFVEITEKGAKIVFIFHLRVCRQNVGRGG